ncbi:hypothetical protein [Succinivibrio faecicola]|uniref:Acyl carrier protein n=1 Tax=Succinivibrio faecicola TaxID=2820300 RepID=A0ABS7DIP6_9GAMM|nr:hypothetical protein [Succinivibrio faecicola]MBW7570725.1 hypothetical protein [Succinivibrio faecicola]
MNKEEILGIITDIVDPEDQLTENTVIAECEDIDSLALLNLFLEFRKVKKDLTITEFSNCKTIKNVINLLLE